MRILRSGDRFVTTGPGIVSRHCFSAGPHYDPDNLGFGALIGLDEHVLDPGAGFDEHAHRGVEIISWVAEGSLRHRDSRGADEVVTAGETLRQDAADGITHTEENASATDPLRLIQVTLIPGAEIELTVSHADLVAASSWWHLFVVAGAWTVDGAVLVPGDSARGDEKLVVTGSGALLALRRARELHGNDR